MINIISLIDRELKPKKMGQVVCLVPRGEPCGTKLEPLFSGFKAFDRDYGVRYKSLYN